LNTSVKRVRKERKGKVVKKSGDKSILVEIERRVKHPIYGKIVTKKKKFMVHDVYNKANVGDVVTFVETRPLSKRKRWKLIKIAEKQGT